MHVPYGLVMSGFVAVASFFITTSDSFAQLSNRPFSFNTGGSGSIGMSTAGKQAILNQELFGIEPKFLLKSADGRLLIGPVRGPGRSALTFSPSGESLPGFRRDFRKGREGISAGAFNAFFVPRSSDGGGVGYIPVAAPSSALVNTWTGRVLTDTGIGYGPLGPVNVWTGSVYGLGPRY